MCYVLLTWKVFIMITLDRIPAKIYPQLVTWQTWAQQVTRTVIETFAQPRVICTWPRANVLVAPTGLWAVCNWLWSDSYCDCISISFISIHLNTYWILFQILKPQCDFIPDCRARMCFLLWKIQRLQRSHDFQFEIKRLKISMRKPNFQGIAIQFHV